MRGGGVPTVSGRTNVYIFHKHLTEKTGGEGIFDGYDSSFGAS